jgi:peroxiredoxin
MELVARGQCVPAPERTGSMRRIVALAVIIALPILVIAADEKDKAAAGGRAAPAFSLKDTKGTAHTLDQYKDKIVVLEWTEPGCPYVIRHAKAGTMAKIASDYKGKNVVFLGVCTSKFTDAAAMQKFLDEQKISYPVLMDTTGATGKAYGATNTPHMFVIKGGKILYEGAIDDDSRGKNEKVVNFVRNALDEIIAGKAVTKAKTEAYGCPVKYPEAPAS